MTKENKKMNKKQIAIIVVAITLIITITAFTYAIWSRTHTQTGVNRNTYACFEIAYEETNGNGVTMENGYPQTDEQGMQNDPYEVEITNTCSTAASYNVILNKEGTSTLADEYLKVAVDEEIQKLSDAQTVDTKTIEGFNNVESKLLGGGYSRS